MRRCSFSVPFSVNCLLHTVHWCGFSPVWIRRCLARWSFREKQLPHTWHSKRIPPAVVGICLVWIWRCLLRLLPLEKFLPHTVHSNSFSPVWMQKCSFRSASFENCFLHTVQLYGFSTVWIHRCPSKWSFVEKQLPHAAHSNGSSPVCVPGCADISHCISNENIHSAHYAIMAHVYVVILMKYEMSIQEMVRCILLTHLYHSKNLVVNSGYRTVWDDECACPHIKDNDYFR